MSQQASIGIFYPHVSLVEATQFERSEEDVPDAVVDLFEPDIFTCTAGADVDPGMIPADAAVGTDVTNFEAVGIFQCRNFVRHRSWRGRVAARRRVLVESFMWSLLVELDSEGVEATLLRRQVGGRRSRRLGLERAVHTLVAPVLLRFSGLDELGQDAQAHPPRRQARQPCEADRCKGWAVVGADSLRQPKLPEDTSEHRLGILHRCGGQSLTAEQEAAVSVGDGQGIAVDPVAGAEVPLEVGAPDLVRCIDGGVRPSGMPQRTSLALDGDTSPCRCRMS